MNDAAGARLELTREQVLAHRRRVGALDERLPPGADSLRRAARAGLQDSVPRAALLSIHARVEDAGSSAWEDPALVQVWGPRFSAYVIAESDRAVFTLGRLPDAGPRRKRAEDTAASLHAFLDGRRMPYGQAGHELGVNPSMLRYAALTGTVLIRWEGARQPVIWNVPRPRVDPVDARLELARRYLTVLGPGTSAGFSDWAGIFPDRAKSAFTALGAEVTAVRTPTGEAWILAADEEPFRTPSGPAAPARLLPSGDPFFLLWGPDRTLVVPDARSRSMLWTPRVWPGALLVGGEIAGVWRRADANVSLEPWRPLSAREREAIEAEALSLPIPGFQGRLRTNWTE